MTPHEQKAFSLIEERQRAYKLAFGSPAGQAVLDDLGEFCRARRSTWHIDSRLHAAMEGRREVYLRIQDYMGMTAEEIFRLYNPQHKPNEDPNG